MCSVREEEEGEKLVGGVGVRWWNGGRSSRVQVFDGF